MKFAKKMIIRWKPIKKDRDRYFVEYTPACDSMFLAFVNLVYIQQVKEKQTVVDDMEKEFDHWLERFPVPLMASAWDFKGDGIEFPDIHADRFLSGYADLAGSVVRTWGILKDSDFPEKTKSTEHRLSVYSELEAITAAEIQEKADTRRRVVRVGWLMVFIWAVAIPSFLAILGFFNLFYVGAIAFSYSLYRAVRKTLEMTGFKKRSRRMEEKDREVTDMRHHHYHCNKNPDGFMRLKIENIERDEIERIRKESQGLQKTPNRVARGIEPPAPTPLAIRVRSAEVPKGQ